MFLRYNRKKVMKDEYNWSNHKPDYYKHRTWNSMIERQDEKMTEGFYDDYTEHYFE